ncbi:MAG TPA: transposase [Pseudonocardiaceae bacterium]|jgi:transposase|nr:transposase [Pseudonocardiaceae bacterium]
MAELDIKAVITDEQWSFVAPLLGPQGGSRPEIEPRHAFAAVVYMVMRGLPWRVVPPEFGLSMYTARRRFLSWTDADLWRHLAATAIGTPHAQWAHRVAVRAIGRASGRARGYPDTHWPANPEPADAKPPGQNSRDIKPFRQRNYPRPTMGEYAEARTSMNGHRGSAL